MSTEANYREVLDALADALFVVDLEQGTILDANARSPALFGFALEELTGRSLAAIAKDNPPFTGPGLHERLARAIDEGAQVFEWQFLRKDGRTFWAEVSLRRADLGGEPRILAQVRDISRRKSIEESLRASRSFLDKAQEVGRIGSWIADVEATGRIVWSAEVYRIFGLPEDSDVTVASFFERVHPDDREAVREAANRSIDQHRPYEIEHRIVRPDGSLRWVLERGDVEYDDLGRPLRILGVVQDIDERKQAAEALARKEELLRHAQKMEAIGRLAGGIAHDFNNLLTAIGGYSSIAISQHGIEGPARECLAEIQKASDRAAALTRQLLAFSRKQVLRPRVLDLNGVVEETHNLLRRLVGENIEFELRLAPDLGPVRVDPGQFEQVLANLVVNARDAMPDGGRLTIATRNRTLDERLAREQGDLEPGAYVELTVGDTGTGMDDATRARLFEPFFTTKSPGKGTGLGLSTVYGIVRQSDGHIEVETAAGSGTTFRILLPRADHDVEAGAAGAPVIVAAPRGDETVLLVEDDQGVREFARRVLETQGYSVLNAHDGSEALAFCERHPARIDLMLSDLVMPRLSGKELWQRAAAMRPRMRVLFMSGYNDGNLVRGGVLESGAPCIQKPFSPHLLAHEVRRVLDARPR